MEAEALAARLRSQLTGLREAQSSQQRSAQERLSTLQAHLQSLAARVVRAAPLLHPLCRISTCVGILVCQFLTHTDAILRDVSD